MNIPYQKIENFDEEKLELKDGKKINSIQICEIFYDKKSIIYGIFDISEYEKKLKEKIIDPHISLISFGNRIISFKSIYNILIYNSC